MKKVFGILPIVVLAACGSVGNQPSSVNTGDKGRHTTPTVPDVKLDLTHNFKSQQVIIPTELLLQVGTANVEMLVPDQGGAPLVTAHGDGVIQCKVTGVS